MSEVKTHIHVLSQVRLHADPRPSKLTETPLSILDAAAVPFPPSRGIWFYESPIEERDSATLSVTSLSHSLQLTVNAYPQWAGQLQLSPFVFGGIPKQRYGRLLLTHGSNSDPGIEFIVAESDLQLDDFLPSAQDWLSGKWDATGIPTNDFVSKTKFALEDGFTDGGRPSLALQLTMFACGGLAIAFKISHSLADTQSSVGFMRDWAAINVALSKKQSLPCMDNVFDPSLLEKATGGDLTSPNPDLAFIKVSRQLPVHRYDRWMLSDTCPSAFRPSMETTKPKLPEGESLSPALSIPWSEWQYLEPSSYFHMYFSALEIRSIWESATTGFEVQVSRLDALVAHLWKCLCRARNLQPMETVYLNIVLGVRPRLAPPLPPKYLGCPTMHVHTSMQGQEMAVVSTGTLAEMIRDTIATFNPDTVPAQLHDMSYEAGAQRLWQFFLGRRHTTCTSWLRQGVSTLEFTPGVIPRYVETGMPPSMDGIIKIMEAPRWKSQNTGNDICHTAELNHKTKATKHWSDDGVLVAMVMNKQVMERLLQDPCFRVGETNRFVNIHG